MGRLGGVVRVAPPLCSSLPQTRTSPSAPFQHTFKLLEQGGGLDTFVPFGPLPTSPGPGPGSWSHPPPPSPLSWTEFSSRKRILYAHPIPPWPPTYVCAHPRLPTAATPCLPRKYRESRAPLLLPRDFPLASTCRDCLVWQAGPITVFHVYACMHVCACPYAYYMRGGDYPSRSTTFTCTPHPPLALPPPLQLTP